MSRLDLKECLAERLRIIKLNIIPPYLLETVTSYYAHRSQRCKISFVYQKLSDNEAEYSPYITVSKIFLSLYWIYLRPLRLK
jgi:hypothetical protein